MSRTCATKLAKIVVKAADIRENSYDNKAADDARKTQDFPNYSEFYTKTLHEAIQIACEQEGVSDVEELIYLAMDTWWNDTIEWAEGVLK